MWTWRSKRIARRILAVGSVVLLANVAAGCYEMGGSDTARSDKPAVGSFETIARMEPPPGDYPPQVLAEGDVFSFRLYFHKSSEATVAKVRLDNLSNDWYDYVEWTSDSGAPFGEFDSPYLDFNFGATNFNTQILNPYNNPKFEPGSHNSPYEVSVIIQNELMHSFIVDWDDDNGGFQPSTYSFQVE